MRGATKSHARGYQDYTISTHAPHAGSDLGATDSMVYHTDFNPRSPCGERPNAPQKRGYLRGFQPTLPMRGATGDDIGFAAEVLQFQPTLPMRGATLGRLGGLVWHGVISTHAPHAGSDYNPRILIAGHGEFQPTLPMRGATRFCYGQFVYQKFQPTLPMRGATADINKSASSILFI